jgi:hypothetical protein
MKFFKISLLLSIGFIGLNTVTTSAGTRIGKDGKIEQQTNFKEAIDQIRDQAAGNPELEQMANVSSLLPGVPTQNTAILSGVSTPKSIDTRLQVTLNSLQTTAIQNFAKQVADYLVETYGKIVAKALVNQMFPTGKKVSDTTTTAQTAKASTVLDTLTSTLGEGMKNAVVAELKRRFLPILFSK